MSRFTPEDCDLSAINTHINLDISRQKEEGEPESSPSQLHMPLPPYTTPAPQLVFMPGMSRRAEAPAPPSSGAEPSPIPLPIRSKPTSDDSSSSSFPSSSSTLDGQPPFPLPKLRLQINDLSHPGAPVFLSAVDASAALASGVQAVLRTLYGSPGEPQTHAPGTRSVTLILRDMDGVAHTVGSDLDSDHKEIHLSLRYIAGVSASSSSSSSSSSSPPPPRVRDEIAGVLVHELVHCFQHDGRGSCPGGLIEGVADFVRLRRGLAPPHWRREEQGGPAARWDAGYQHTAYFLDYLEGRFGAGTVRRLNEKLRARRYEEKAFWTELLGAPVGQLWQNYRDEVLDGGKGGGGDKEKDEDKEVAAQSGIDEGTQT